MTVMVLSEPQFDQFKLGLPGKFKSLLPHGQRMFEDQWQKTIKLVRKVFFCIILVFMALKCYKGY